MPLPPLLHLVPATQPLTAEQLAPAPLPVTQKFSSHAVHPKPPVHAVQPEYALAGATHVLVVVDRHCVSGFSVLHSVHLLMPSEHVWHVALGPHVVADGPAPGFVMQSESDAHCEHPPVATLVLSWLHTPHFPLLPDFSAFIGYEPTAVHVCEPGIQQ